MTDAVHQPPPGYYPPPGALGYVPPPPPPYTIGAAFTWAWFHFRKNWKFFVTGMLPTVVISLVYYAFFIALYLPFTWDLQTQSLTDDDAVEFLKKMAILHAAFYAASIVTIALYANMLRAALMLADGHAPTFRTLVSTKRLGRVMVACILLMLGMMIGMVLCYVPGLALALFSMFTLPFIIDKELPIFAAFKASFSLVRANFGLVLLTALAIGGVSYAGAMALLVGIAVSTPVALLLLAYAYRSLVPAGSPAE